MERLSPRPSVALRSPDVVAERAGITVLVERRYRAQRQPAGLLAALERRGVHVAVTDPELLVHDLGPRPWGDGRSWLDDVGLVVARGRSPSLLTALAVAESFGVRTVNRSSAVAAVRDKAAMAAALVAAGVPTPRTWVGPAAELAASIEPGAYPVVVKPVFGDNGRGVRLVAGAGDLQEAAEPVLAQQFVGRDPAGGIDGGVSELKVYAVGSRHWAVRVPSLFGGQENGRAGPEPVPMTAELADLAEACGKVFGLELLGIDCLVGPDGPVVVEVNDFPNYRGADGSDDVLAEYVLDVAGSVGR